MRLALVVEGYGDTAAFPNLVARVGQVAGQPVFGAEPLIRAGGARRLKRPGELERFLELAASRPDVDGVLVLLDLDDDCAATFYAEFRARAAPITDRFEKRIDFCFCVREYESWFLADIENLRNIATDYTWDHHVEFPEYQNIRGAKEALSRAIINRRYRQTRDQLPLTRKLNIRNLGRIDRSFRKFIKIVTGLDYTEIDRLCADD